VSLDHSTWSELLTLSICLRDKAALQAGASTMSGPIRKLIGPVKYQVKQAIKEAIFFYKLDLMEKT